MSNTELPAVVFDVFGVLVTRHTREFMQKNTNASDQETIRTLGSEHERGTITTDEYYSNIASLTRGLSAQDCREQMIAERELNVDLMQTIARQRKLGTYSLHILSNTGSDFEEYFKPNDNLEAFDTITTSYETGFVKPDPRIFAVAEHAIRQVYSPSVILFVDDSANNCAAAEKANWDTIHYTTNEELHSSLQQRLY